jgi:type IV pilus assembly protein PilA
MLKAFQRRVQEGRQEEGFTLIELMVVVLIIAILIAIAIPTFLGARSRAQDRAAQSSLRNSLTAAKTIFTDAESYTAASSGALSTAEPSLTFVASTTASSGANNISVNPVSATVFIAAALSGSGSCFLIRDDTSTGANAGTMYAKLTTTATITCAANATTASFSTNGWG